MAGNASGAGRWNGRTPGDRLARQLDTPEDSATDVASQASALKLSILSMDGAAEAILSALLGDHPTLGLHGYWKPETRVWRVSREDFDRARPEVLAPEYVEAFLWCRVVLQLGCRRLVSPLSRRGSNSYGLKHVAEHAAVAVLNRPLYVPNGVLIFAALSLGLRVERDGDGPNALVNVRALWRAGD